MKQKTESTRQLDPNAQARDSAKAFSGIAPLAILRAAIRAVPAVKYALGIAGIVAAIAIVCSFGIDLRIAVFGTIITFVLMVALVVFAKLTTKAPRYFVAPALVMTWTFLILTIATAALLFSSVFFKWPVDLQLWLKGGSTARFPNRLNVLPASDVLKVAYTFDPPSPAAQFAKPGLLFGISAKRKGEEKFSALRDGDSLTSGADDYCVIARALSDGYLYIFQVDSAGKLEWLFPQNAQSKFSAGSNPLTAGQTIQIPTAEQERMLYLDSITGIEHVYAVFAAARWPALENELSKPVLQSSGVNSEVRSVSVQEPNRLGLRGIEGTRVSTKITDVEATLFTDRVHEGKTLTLPFASKPQEASGSCLVEERWFRHVAR